MKQKLTKLRPKEAEAVCRYLWENLSDIWSELNDSYNEAKKAGKTKRAEEIKEKSLRFYALVEKSSHVKMHVESWKSREEELSLLIHRLREEKKNLEDRLKMEIYDHHALQKEMNRLTEIENKWQDLKQQSSERKTT